MPKFGGKVETVAADLSEQGVAAELVAARPDLIFHLAAIVSGEAEADFEKGYRVNLDGTRDSLRGDPAARALKQPYRAESRLHLVDRGLRRAAARDHRRTHFLTPLTSYGTQKAIGELLLADYSRRGFFDGIGIRLPTISIRPGKPNKAASRLLLHHPARAAGRPGGRAAGRAKA